MRRAFLSIILSFIAFNALSQDVISVGVAAGSSHYIGDYNKSNPLFSPSPSFGFLLKNEFGLRTSVRFSFFYTNLNGALDKVDDFNYLPRQISSQSFQKKFMDIAFSLEYNFLPYNPYNEKKDNFTPFVFAGVGTDYFFDNEKNNFPVTIPFGLGIKYNIFERFSIGFEWNARKLFFDTMDGVENITDPGNEPMLHNNDWYHMGSIFITFKPFQEEIDCPAYED